MGTTIAAVSGGETASIGFAGTAIRHLPARADSRQQTALVVAAWNEQPHDRMPKIACKSRGPPRFPPNSRSDQSVPR